MTKKDIVTRAFHGGRRVMTEQVKLGKKGNLFKEIGEILTPHGVPGVDYSKRKRK